MKDEFDIAAGSVIGRDHVIAGKNNQDAYAIARMPVGMVAVVCDGCGSRPSSEVGAKIGAQLVSDAVMKYCVYGFDERRPADPRTLPGAAAYLEDARQHILKELRSIAKAMGGELRDIVNDFFLFTVVGTVVMDLATWTFSIGDGVVAMNPVRDSPPRWPSGRASAGAISNGVNGTVRTLGPFPKNEPPYLSYGLLPTSLTDTAPELLRFQVHDVLPTAAVQSVFIGSDGVVDLMEREGQKIPGKDERVPPLAQFWTEDRYFKNPDMIRRRFAMMNRETTTINWEGREVQKCVGLLPDDTTVVVIRRKG
ncbi:protein phosphatase 2C domain-containing protein [Candidatus Uhrbacteria bacterium]|nr:protein phosphatase 2C domain-containing protein [Candidatus Uhrbacteria bacterium]